MQDRIWLSPPHLNGNEIQYVNDAFNSNWVAPIGPNVDGFESDISSYLNENRFITALNSGTSAIHLALLLLNISKGDNVLCQSNTFIASANPILYVGANPIFIDSEKDTWNLCPELLTKAIEDAKNTGKLPKAIITVHTYGMPYRANEINTIAKSYNIPIIEDSAEAFGSKYGNQKCGTLGDLSVLSFNGNKIITTSSGGALITKSKEEKDKALFLATQAKAINDAYEHHEIGFNYRMSNICAGIGRGQISSLDDYVEKRRAIYDYYKNAFSNYKSIEFLDEPRESFSNRWLTCVLFNDSDIRDNVYNKLKDQNIESRLLWKPLHTQPIFKDKLSYINGISEDLFNRGLSLPSGSNLSTEQQNRIIEVIQSVITN